MMFLSIISLLIYRSFAVSYKNLLVLMIDDLGYDDIDSFETPNLRELRENGIRFTDYHTAITCTPSRGSFLTGMYPSNIGLTSALLLNNPNGLSGYDTLPMLFAEKGYNTFLIGKWHLGYAKKEFLPTRNGFQRFYGTLNGASDHYTKKLNGINDLYDNETPTKNNTYSTILYTDKTLETFSKDKPFFTMLSYQAVHTPLQVPDKYIQEWWCSAIKNWYRRLYCGMISSIDESVGILVKRLRELDIYKDTLILVTTDNGGQPWFGASNYPLRGTKNSLWEGGTKGIGFLSGGSIDFKKKGYISQRRPRTFDGLFHISDWLPTISHIFNLRELPNTDGINMWESILNNKNERHEVLLHYDEYTNSLSYRIDYWKFMKGNTGDSTLFPKYEDVLCPMRTTILDVVSCLMLMSGSEENYFTSELIRELRNVLRGESIGGGIVSNFFSGDTDERLYNLKDDQYETRDLSGKYPIIVDIIKKKFKKPIVPQRKWYISDSNVKHRYIRGEYWFSPWIFKHTIVTEVNLLPMKFVKTFSYLIGVNIFKIYVSIKAIYFLYYLILLCKERRIFNKHNR